MPLPNLDSFLSQVLMSHKLLTSLPDLLPETLTCDELFMLNKSTLLWLLGVSRLEILRPLRNSEKFHVGQVR